ILRKGADKISLNTAAVKNPRLVRQGSRKFGNQCIVVAVDAKRRTTDHGPQTTKPGWEVYIYGGKQPTGIDVIEWVKKVEALGAGEILLTSMDCDGTQAGYDIELTRAVSEAVKIPVIASGGAGNLEHLYEALSKGKADAVLAASIFHYGTYTVHQSKQYLARKGLTMRF
ncbi:MAG: HisA/HisF-related TIM barrel protein, partial [Candidatus Omnitrophica bacterium]|nr:HisA/HisF-related TIM barrel protein [Candidatus Omnitrophota bacterium]